MHSNGKNYFLSITIYRARILLTSQSITHVAPILIIAAQLFRLQKVVHQILHALIIGVLRKGQLQFPKIVHLLALRAALPAMRHRHRFTAEGLLNDGG